jgi:hypothetical protein
VNLLTTAVVIVAATAASVGVMSFARRRAPAGGFFTDSDRAAGVFGVLGTAFAVLLAFVIFVAFGSYVNAKEKAGQEAIAVSELYHTARLLPSPARETLPAQTICYARAVIDDEWPAMMHQRQSARVQGWVAGLDAGIAGIDIRGQATPVAYGHWLTESAARQEGRRGRLSEAAPFVPFPLWLVLMIGAVVLIGYMCFFADRGEPFFVQAMMIASITAVVVSGLLVIRFLDRPYENRVGSIEPVEMRHTLRLLERQQQSGPKVRERCDAQGRPLRRT